MASAAKAPLRKIVGYETNTLGLSYEILECGHRKRPRQDIYGETNAIRRRCKKCVRRPADHVGETR